MQRSLPLIGAALLIVATVAVGAVFGMMSNRWAPAVDVEAIRVRVETLPMAFGDWEVRDSESFQPQTLKLLQCYGYVNRRYVNKKTAELVQVAVLAGPSGPIAAHTPDVCYPALALDIAEASSRQKVRENEVPQEQFARATFKSRGLDAQFLRVWYAWSNGRPWDVPRSPRWHYSGSPVLYKIQIASAVSAEPTQGQDDAGQNFLRDFLPVLDASLLKRTAKS